MGGTIGEGSEFGVTKKKERVSEESEGLTFEKLVSLNWFFGFREYFILVFGLCLDEMEENGGSPTEFLPPSVHEEYSSRLRSPTSTPSKQSPHRKPTGFVSDRLAQVCFR